MQIHYHPEFDHLYLRFDARPQSATNLRVNDSTVLDVGADGRMVDMEISDASHTVRPASILRVKVQIHAASSV